MRHDADVAVHTAAFEDWPLPAAAFDLVMGAASLHWVHPAVRWRKTAAALAPGGSVATFDTWHVAGGDDAAFAEMQRCYEWFLPGTPPGLRLPDAADVPDARADEAEASGLFAAAQRRRYAWECVYDREAYLRLLCTYSRGRALEPESRAAFLACIAEVIDRLPGARVRKVHLTQLMVAQRRARTVDHDDP